MEEAINFLSFNAAEEYIENPKHINKYKTMQEGVKKWNKIGNI